MHNNCKPKAHYRRYRSQATGFAIAVMCSLPVAASALAPRTSQIPKDVIKLCGPTYTLRKHEFKLPAAFWNEHLCNWLDVALCGRPSNFLHETVLSIEATRTIVRHAMQKIDFHAATSWAPNFKVFGQIRGQPVLILVRFPLNGKIQTFPLDELIRFNGWSRSAGPLGWIYLGTPGIYQLPEHLRNAKPGQTVTPKAILYNDPQIAMNYRGIRSQSQALLNNSLCTDNWVYPDIRFYRNPRLVPMAVFNSNGKVHADIIFRRVSEVQLLKAVIKYWHAASLQPVIKGLLPLAKKMDMWRRSLWKQVHANPHAWSTSKTVQIEAAELRHGYAEMTYQCVRWSATHSHFSATATHTLAAIKTQARRFLAHLHDQVRATLAWVHYRQAQKINASTPATKRAKLAATLYARSQFLLDSNLQYLRYWKLKFNGISPEDPRHLWIAMIKAQYAEAKARNREALAGIAYAKVLSGGHAGQIMHAMITYETAVIAARIADLKVVVLQYKFRISNDTGFAGKTHIEQLKHDEKKAQTQISHLQHELHALLKKPPR
jgi:hypothetical protein